MAKVCNNQILEFHQYVIFFQDFELIQNVSNIITT